MRAFRSVFMTVSLPFSRTEIKSEIYYVINNIV